MNAASDSARQESGTLTREEASRKRPRTACTRCKTRKQRCDSQWPICSNCQKSGAECDKAALDIEEQAPAGYTRALEDRVAFLEIQLKKAKRVHQNDGYFQSTPASSGSPSNDQTVRGSAMRELVDFLSVGNDESPAYIGSASGLSLAVNLGEMVQATVWNKALPLSPDETQPAISGHVKAKELRNKLITLDSLRANSAGPPDDQLGSRIVDAYFTRLHPRYPFLDPIEVWRLHADRMRLSRLNASELSGENRFGLFKLYLVYAIGTVSLQLTEKLPGVSPEAFYFSALQHVSAARETRSNHNIEAMTLLVMYHLRSASSHGLWYMIGLAMRTCVDFGLHRKGNEQSLDDRTIQIRRRLFWSVYSLERVIAISLGRPFSISDKHMDVELPAEHDDVLADSPLCASHPSVRRCSNITFAVALFSLRRIESRIQHSVYRVDRAIPLLKPKLDRLYEELNLWQSSLTKRFSGSELDYLMLHYNRAMRLLVQPFLSFLSPLDSYYQMCLRASGDTCQTHKRLHQTQHYGHSFISVQTVFVAGITILYCLWTSGDRVWSVRVADDIRACSSVLFVMGERASWVRKYRDAFDSLVSATMDKLQGPSNAGAAPTSTPLAGQLPVGSDASQNSYTMKMVQDLAGWIGQDDGMHVWMPDFDTLGNLGEYGEYFV